MADLFRHRINFVGCPSAPLVPWTRENLQRLSDLGFNRFQLNIAWGCRPADEPLNLEDVVDCSGMEFLQKLPLQSDTDPQAIAARRENLRNRIALCREMGLPTIFHFGAPYNMHARFGDTSPNCLSDDTVLEMYKSLIRRFAEQYPGVDDLLLYTYDQDAWLCSEFGDCPRCVGVPLHERVSHFVNELARTWQQINPAGRLWWEPWELSAGQVLMCIDRLDPSCVAMALHCTIAEVMSAMPVDIWLRNAVAAAKRAGVTVVVEHFLGAPTEEVEPFTYLSWPLEIWRGLKAIAEISPDGIKEYYGTIPDREDANLRMTGLFLANPDRTAAEALAELAQPYGKCGEKMIEFWHATSAAMRLFPWDTSWWIREVGKADPTHSMDAAFIRGQQAHTPSWESNRRAAFMYTDNAQPDAWALEDVQLRCQLCADELKRAVDIAADLPERLPAHLAGPLKMQIGELTEWRRRAIAYVCHLRETNLCAILRKLLSNGETPSPHVISELRKVMTEDMQNQATDEPCQTAIALLETDLKTFLDTYFKNTGPDLRSRGEFSVTSR